MSNERNKYRGEVWYEVWRHGLPEGALSDDRIDDAFDAGIDIDHLVAKVARRRYEARQEQQAEEQQEYESQEPEEKR